MTGEAVVVELDAARVPTRAIAFGIDATIQLLLLVLGTFLVTGALQLDDAAAAAGVVVLLVVVLVGYPLLWETLARGRSPGKAALGLRVVRDDGGPVTFRHALVRALLAVFVDLWLTMGTVGVVVSLASARGKRVGDVLAGTFVVHERVRARTGAVPDMPAPLAGWARTLDLTDLSAELALAGRGFLARRGELSAAARTSTATRLADEVVALVSPPPPAGTSAEAYLAAVVAERRRREHERLAAPSDREARASTSPPPPSLSESPNPAMAPHDRPASAPYDEPDAPPSDRPRGFAPPG